MRSVDGQELKLPTWEQFSNEDPPDERATEQMLIGVSTRKYARSLEPLPEDLDAFGTSKSAVSRRFVKQTTAQVEEFFAARSIPLLVCADARRRSRCRACPLVAVGIDEQGYKHVLGMREGASENAVSAVNFCVICASAECRQSAVCLWFSTAARHPARPYAKSSGSAHHPALPRSQRKKRHRADSQRAGAERPPHNAAGLRQS